MSVIVVMINDCVTGTAADAFFRGYRIIVPENCVEAITEEAQKTALEYMKTIYGCKITKVDKLMKEELVWE